MICIRMIHSQEVRLRTEDARSKNKDSVERVEFRKIKNENANIKTTYQKSNILNGLVDGLMRGGYNSGRQQ